MLTEAGNFLNESLANIKGIGEQKALLLATELGIYTCKDLLQYFPFRHEDRTKITQIGLLTESSLEVQVICRLLDKKIIGAGRAKRLVCKVSDESGVFELIWFQGVDWQYKRLQTGQLYLVYGKPNWFKNKGSFAHPEIEFYDPAKPLTKGMMPVYSLTEKLRTKNFTSKQLGALIGPVLERAFSLISDPLPQWLRIEEKLIEKNEAIRQMHFPESHQKLERAIYRLKYDDFFYHLLRMGLLKESHIKETQGAVFEENPKELEFLEKVLPFSLTGAQARVWKEIKIDLVSGIQMNRLLQGDVGSGKTAIAFLSMLKAVENGYQACLMAPTEILTEQHFTGLRGYAESLGYSMALLTGSTKTAARKEILYGLATGTIQMVVGTHALLEEKVQFAKLGLAVIDEQHRFGVAQRARLWTKGTVFQPHLLVMTATPIPRTLALTYYGDLDVSVIDELPPGRKPIKTGFRPPNNREALNDFLKAEIAKGRQVYMVYPLIEESEKMDLENLETGLLRAKEYFPEPDYQISMVHGKMPKQERDDEMARFVKGETQIMVATTVIEVGVNVPNASVMVIESAERFGLSQLHQLRGRVGRGAEQSYCILMHGPKLSYEGKIRLQTMAETQDGFKISEVDMQLRGPGDVLGTRQSGQLEFLLADMVKDAPLLEMVKEGVDKFLVLDKGLNNPQHLPLKLHVERMEKEGGRWSRIS